MPDGGGGPLTQAVSTAQTFDELFEAVPLRGIKRAQVAQHGRFPVIDQSADACAGWSDDAEHLYAGPLPALVFCDHTRRFKLLDGPFVPAGEGLRVLRPRERLDPVFAHHLLRAVQLPDRGYARHFGLLRGLAFWVPPLGRQRAVAQRLERAQVRLTSARARLEAAAALVDRLMRGTVASGLGGEGESHPFERCFSVRARRGKARLQPEGRYPVVDQNPTRLRGRTDDAKGLVEETPVIVFGDHTRCVQWVDEAFVPASDGVKVLRAREGVDLRYGYWLLRAVQLRDRGYARHLRELRQRSFVVPPLQHQRELAGALDRAAGRVEQLQRHVARARTVADTLERALWTEALEALEDWT